MINQYGGSSTPWHIKLPGPPKDEYVHDLEHVPARQNARGVCHSALEHLKLHPDAALLAYRLLSQRFTVSG